MSRQEKLVSRMLSVPKDFTWEELVKVLSLFGYLKQKAEKPGDREEGLRTGGKTLSRFISPIRPTSLKAMLYAK